MSNILESKGQSPTGGAALVTDWAVNPPGGAKKFGCSEGRLFGGSPDPKDSRDSRDSRDCLRQRAAHGEISNIEF